MQTRVAAVFVFVSFTSLLSVAGVPALMREVKVILSGVVGWILLSMDFGCRDEHP